jgi:DNA-directed RNA polymerase subunit RPC12/RpoP
MTIQILKKNNMERRKLFSSAESTKVRRSLFSDSSVKIRRSLFSDNPYYQTSVDRAFSEIRTEIDNKKPRRRLFTDCAEDTGCQCNSGSYHYECQDCGQTFCSDDHGKVRCPNCGGDRVVCCEDSNGSCASFEDDKEFSETSSMTDEILKTFSCKTVSEDCVNKTFSEHGISETAESMIDAGYATKTDDGQICFSERPDLMRKMFSCLEISVTKVLGLDPVDSREALIHRLSESPRMTPKAIVLITKAHGCCPPQEDWISDSHILEDLKVQHGGHEMPLSGFQGIIREQYSDAPSDILDKLVSLGAIDIAGNRVIIKH